MGLTDRLSKTQAKGLSPARHPIQRRRLTYRRDRAPAQGRDCGQLAAAQVKVHNKLFETIDVAKLESLEPAMVSVKR